jgi:Ca2+-binding RTX toxin-like protein
LGNVHGKEGNDHLYGGAGHDLLYGDSGNDTIYADDGSDTIDGGAGTDTIKYTLPKANYTLVVGESNFNVTEISTDTNDAFSTIERVVFAETLLH